MRSSARGWLGVVVVGLALGMAPAAAQSGRDTVIESIDNFRLEEIGTVEAGDGTVIGLEVGVGSFPDLPDEPLAVFFLTSSEESGSAEPVGMLTYDEAGQFSITLAFFSLVAATTRDATTLPRTLEHWIAIGMDEGAGVQLGLICRPGKQGVYLSLNSETEAFTAPMDVEQMQALQALLDEGLSRVETLLGIGPPVADPDAKL
jgi:hypothetical protein